MRSVLDVLGLVILLFIDLVGYLMVIRCFLEWFTACESKFYELCYAVSEPVVAPVRRLLDRVTSLQMSGIDFSYLATYLFLMIIRVILLSVT